MISTQRYKQHFNELQFVPEFLCSIFRDYACFRIIISKGKNLLNTKAIVKTQGFNNGFGEHLSFLILCYTTTDFANPNWKCKKQQKIIIAIFGKFISWL